MIGRTVECIHRRWSPPRDITVYDDKDESRAVVRVGSGHQCLDCGIWEYLTVPVDAGWIPRFVE